MNTSIHGLRHQSLTTSDPEGAYCTQQTNHSIVVAGELETLALKSDWGIQKVYRMKFLLNTYPIADITLPITEVYGQIDAFSQGKLKDKQLSMSPRNMGKNDIWIAATALYLDLELHTTDNDFNHLPALGLRLVKH
ncbi:type II toxin-antitoxin system VapC family toxin [Spirosoma aureum]|uniref:Type II toxin-antitoxin system VapC family toxin n=1 Tax=Spirosoma aureum TaxID=2692134 RepID=A0A6G9AG34_9BACT|nr:type II toxin-antitoxin system VapC family toxin [Spirosoma aureum]QIP11421.1 type II toxin-antitoxin system VapC family toxin [Spirosoma aureum]